MLNDPKLRALNDTMSSGR